MGPRQNIRVPLIGLVGTILSLGCVDAPVENDWVDAYLAHGPLDPADGVAKMERVTDTPRDEMFQALSPDGSTLLFVSGWFYLDHSVADATLMGIDPNNPSNHNPWVRTDGWALSPTWMPDGSSFLYVTNLDGSWKLVRSRSSIASGEFDVIFEDDEAKPMNPSVSPDGKRVAFSLEVGSTRHVAVSPLDGSEVRILSVGDHPSWSPKGNGIVFQGPDGRGQIQLFSVDPDLGLPKQRTFGNASSLHPSHDPTGNYVVFGSTRGHEHRRCKVCCGLFMMRSDGSDVIPLVGGDVDADWPSWGADGWIYFSSNEAGDYDVWRLRLGSQWDGERLPATPTGEQGRTD